DRMRQYKFINFSQFCMLVLAIGLTGCSDEKEIYLEGIEVEAGLKLELVAAEPLVIDPVAYAFDETGKMYVVENRRNPDTAEGGSPAVREGRIVRSDERRVGKECRCRWGQWKQRE